MHHNPSISNGLEHYRPFRLTPDLTHLQEDERRILPYLLRAASAMDVPAWIQEYGDRESLLASTPDPALRRMILINLGPWDRMRANESFIPGIGAKPAGANYYPTDIRHDEFLSAAEVDPSLKSPYSMVRRDEAGNLIAIPYHQFFSEHVRRAAEALAAAAELADSTRQRNYLSERASALLSDQYRASDSAWMEPFEDNLDILLGPMEIEDRLFGIKTTFSAAVLVRDPQASSMLSSFAGRMESFQKSIPVGRPHRNEPPGLSSDLHVVDAVQFNGLDSVAVPVGIAWPADEQVQLTKGVRSLLVRNVMRAKYEASSRPLADMLLESELLAKYSFEAQFQRVMFHELAHGLGVKYVRESKETVREALRDLQHPFEEAKAELLGQHIALQLHRQGELTEDELEGIFVSSLVATLANADGDHPVMRLNYFMESGAYRRDLRTGKYGLDTGRMLETVEKMAGEILEIQSAGDYQQARRLMERYGEPTDTLTADLARVGRSAIPDGIYIDG